MKNKNIGMRRTLVLLASIGLLATLCYGTYLFNEPAIAEKACPLNKDMWIPTPDDIAYQDSMYSIIQNTQNDVTDIKEDIVLILERLDYADGTWDSIRYVKGGKIDKRRN